MKLVYTFVLVSFALSMVLYIGGMTEGNDFSAIGLFIDVVNNGINNSTLWLALLGFGAIVFTTVTANALTGGNASVGITLGLSAMIAWAISLAGDFLTVIKIVGAKCVVNGVVCTGMDSIPYYIIWVFGGLLAVGFVWSLFDLLMGND